VDFTVVTAPTLEPITLDEAKEQCRVDGTSEDTYIEGLIKAARRWIEKTYGLALNTQTLDGSLDGFPCGAIQVLKYPLISVTSVTYYDDDLSTSTVFSSASYQVDTRKRPPLIVLKNGVSWPTDSLRLSSGVVVRGVFGFGATMDTVPEEIREAVKLLVAQMYTHRVPEVTGTIVQNIEFAVGALLSDYRLWT
jgi:uncharacterized phiE125 gp8 family phage protein